MSDTTTTLTLTDFLRARIEEDEAEAGEWHRADCERNTYDVGPCDCGLPARVLAECKAHRRIVKVAQRVDGLWDEVVALLATVYADHPDYREEWRP